MAFSITVRAPLLSAKLVHRFLKDGNREIERTFLTMDEGVQRFPFQKNKVMDIVGLFFFF